MLSLYRTRRLEMVFTLRRTIPGANKSITQSLGNVNRQILRLVNIVGLIYSVGHDRIGCYSSLVYIFRETHLLNQITCPCVGALLLY
jgi:hypothetical protein